MDDRRFDALARILATRASRRAGLAALLAALGLPGVEADAEPAGEGRREGKGRGGRGGKEHGRNRPRRRGKRERCDPRPRAAVCRGACGPRTDNCGKRVDCGPCSCVDCAGCCDGATCVVDGAACSGNRLCAGGVCRACDVCASGCAFGNPVAAFEAGDGGPIYLCPGRYEIGPADTFDTATRNLTLIGAGMDATTIEGGAGRQDAVVSAQGGRSVLLRALTVTGAIHNAFPLDAVISVTGNAEVTLEGVRLTGNQGKVAGAIYNLHGTVTLDQGSRIEDNAASFPQDQAAGGVFNVPPSGGGRSTLILRGGSAVTGNTTADADLDIANGDVVDVVDGDAGVCIDLTNVNPAAAGCPD